jgi:hypothetical protein
MQALLTAGKSSNQPQLVCTYAAYKRLISSRILTLLCDLESFDSISLYRVQLQPAKLAHRIQLPNIEHDDGHPSSPPFPCHSCHHSNCTHIYSGTAIFVHHKASLTALASPS